EGIVFKTTPAELAWVVDHVGCGGGHPTILLQHGAVMGPQLWIDAATVVVKEAVRTKPIAIVAGGHWGSAVSTKVLRPNALTGRTQLLVYSNWQEIALHNGGGLSKPHGATEVYSAGIYYTVVRIDPDAKRLTAWDWSPYWRSRKMGNVGTNGPATSSIDVPFDLDGLFP